MGGVRVLALEHSVAGPLATRILRELGADHLINYRSQPEWGAVVRELTDGRGVDHIVEVGGVGNLPKSIEACAMGGHIALMGVLTGREGVIPTGQLLRRQIRA